MKTKDLERATLSHISAKVFVEDRIKPKEKVGNSVVKPNFPRKLRESCVVVHDGGLIVSLINDSPSDYFFLTFPNSQ